MKRRHFLNSAAKLGAAGSLLGSSMFTAHQAMAQEASNTILVGFAAGGSSDGVARIIANQLSERSGKSFVVENRTGANGRLAVDKLVQGTEGQNLFLISPFSSFLFAALTTPSWKIDIFKDLKPVANLTNYPLSIAVSPKIGVNNLHELVQWLKKNPGHAAFGTSGLGGHNHLLGLAIGKAIGVPLEVVAYKGNAPLVTDMIGGHTPLAVGVAGDFMPYGEKIKILTVLTEGRYELLPDIPTAKEFGLNITSGDAWYGMWASSNVPAPFAQEVSSLIQDILKDPKVITQLKEKYAMTAGYLDAIQLNQRLRSAKEYWEKIIADTGFKPA